MWMHLCIGLSALASVLIAAAVWAWLGPFACSIASGAAFYAGCMVTLALLNQGRT